MISGIQTACTWERSTFRLLGHLSARYTGIRTRDVSRESTDCASSRKSDPTWQAPPLQRAESLKDNPYAVPIDFHATAHRLGTREKAFASRQQLVQLIDQLLERRITECYFEDCVSELDCSKDPMLRTACDTLALMFCDAVDTYYVPKRQTWGHLQRIQLALISGGQVHSTMIRHWQWRQLAVGIIMAVYAVLILCLAISTGLAWSWTLLVAHLLLTFGTFYFAGKVPKQSTPKSYEQAIAPFASFRDLETAYKNTGFRKKRFRPLEVAIKSDSPFDRVISHVVAGVFALFWVPAIIVFSPLAMACFLLPTVEKHATVSLQ